MTNKNVIEIIDRLMDRDAEKLAYNATEVFTAIVHGYYYIRPGKDTTRFLKKINRVLKDGHNAESRKHTEMKEGIPFETWLLGKMASDMIAVARTMFDEEYYKSQIALMVKHEKYDDSLFKRYLYCLNDEELECVCEGILTFKHRFDVFFTDDEYGCMMENIYEMCNLVCNDEHIENPIKNPLFFFNYLDRETLINTLCYYVDTDHILLAHMIKTFRYAGAKSAAEYTGMAIWLMRELEQDIFNPKITDMSKIRLEDYDYRHSKVIHSNRSGKVMLA